MADIEKKNKELAVSAARQADRRSATHRSATRRPTRARSRLRPDHQTAILGMHAKDRPMAVDGKVEIPLMMYPALSYDHRLIDGRESVGFPVTIKELLEDPSTHLLLTCSQQEHHPLPVGRIRRSRRHPAMVYA